VITFGVVAAISYLIGSFPAGYLAGRLADIDIRKQGSGNIGATNVTRVLGKRYGYPVFALDLLKGFAAVSFSSLIAKHRGTPPESLQFFQLAATVSCVLGHSFPVWLRFRGGKGVAASAGALFAMMPLAAVIVIILWIIIFQITRYVSVASMTAVLALPITVALLMQLKKTDDRVFVYFSVAVAAVIILRHRSNLSRLMRGTEPRFRKGEDQ
jgi:glycerol-3-phosphate acyltransferase PlsY